MCISSFPIKIEPYEIVVRSIEDKITPIDRSPSKKLLGENEQIVLDKDKFKRENSPTREKYKLFENESVSLTDAIFDNDQLILQEGTPIEIANKYSSLIGQHVERRIEFFFMQLISCYKTGITFDAKGAIHQAQSAKTCYTQKKANQTHKTSRNKHKAPSEELVTFTRNAAHCAVLPCLINKKTKEVYLANTHSYFLQNSTIAMARTINEVDMSIDGDEGDKKLRYKALEIINELAKEESVQTPQESLESFIKKYLNQVKISVKYFKKNSSEENKAKHYIATQYQNVIKDILEEFKKNKNQFIEALLALQINDNDFKKSDSFRKMAYKIRYQTIRDSEFAFAKIAEKIEILRKSIRSYFPKKETLTHFERAFKIICIDSCKSDLDKKTLRKIFNVSEGYLRDGKYFTNTIEKIKTEKECIKSIKKVIGEVLYDIKALHRMDVDKRGAILREIRKELNMTQKKLSEYLSGEIAFSQSTLSKIENGGRTLSRSETKIIASALGLDEVLLLPRNFYDRSIIKSANT
jgi:hypothetical protein